MSLRSISCHMYNVLPVDYLPKIKEELKTIAHSIYENQVVSTAHFFSGFIPGYSDYAVLKRDRLDNPDKWSHNRKSRILTWSYLISSKYAMSIGLALAGAPELGAFVYVGTSTGNGIILKVAKEDSQKDRKSKQTSL